MISFRRKPEKCAWCHGLGWCYNEWYEGTSLEYCGPVCERCGGSGKEPRDGTCLI